MIQVSNITLPLGASEEELREKAGARLGCAPASLGAMHILKKSIDARKKSDIHYVYTLGFGEREADGYEIPQPQSSPTLRPVVVGLGPAGLFAAYALAKAGLRPLVIERGQPVEQRRNDVARFWQGGALNPESNVQFGEGGAGTFSDGKLSTGTKSRRHPFILEQFVRFGADESIRYLQKPHIGTDVLEHVVANMRQELLALGCEIRFGTRLDGLCIRGGALTELLLSDGSRVETDACVLAIGHSARDSFAMLRESGVEMMPKPFAIGVRIEHPQALIGRAQYGAVFEQLPAADYKLSCHAPNGRSAFSFCVCPGGEVVAAASEAGHLVTNGMSRFARDNAYINGGLLVNVTPGDFASDDVLAGVAFQRIWEKRAFEAAGGSYAAPAHRVGDFLSGVPSKGNLRTSYRPATTAGDICELLPPYVTDTLRYALTQIERKLHGFADENAVLIGVETRSSSPVRILRGPEGQSTNVKGLYPTGEGAGYAGGIMSAANDGLAAAEAIIGRR